MFKFLLTSALLLGTLSASVIEVEMEEKTQKPLKLTESQINRIAAIDGSIATIIGNPNAFNVRIDENLGQAFITLKQSIEIPEGITVVTGSGSTQDFLVTSLEGEPTIVYLSQPPEPAETFQNSLATIETLAGIFEGEVPHGFGKRGFRQHETIEVGPLLEYIQSIDVYEGALEDLFVIKIINHQRKPLTLDKTPFEASLFNWAFCPAKELRKNEETIIVVSKRRV